MKLLLLALLPSCAALKSPDEIGPEDTATGATTDVTTTDTSASTQDTATTDTAYTEVIPEIVPQKGNYVFRFEKLTDNSCGREVDMEHGDIALDLDLLPSVDGVTVRVMETDYSCEWADGSDLAFICELAEEDDVVVYEEFRDLELHMDVDFGGEWFADNELTAWFSESIECRGEACDKFAESPENPYKELPCITSFDMSGRLVE